MNRTDKLNAVTDTWQRKGISTSELVEAMEHACVECDRACMRLNSTIEECCNCAARDILCETCVDERDRQAEKAHEQFIEDFYGGSQPFTIEEQYQAAAEEKRKLK